VNPVSAPRVAPLAVDGLAPEGRDLLRGRLPVADPYLTGAADAPPLPAILGLFGHHPRLGADWLTLSAGMLDDPVLDPRDRELLILRVSARTGSRYEWSQHTRIGRSVGIGDDQLTAVAGDPADPIWTTEERDLLDAVDQMIDDRRVGDATWRRLAHRFDERQLLELLFVIGSYLCLALVLNSVGLEPDPGTDGDIPDLDGGAR
jgi:alkylhydroperoxidase family enzyme